MRSVRRFVVLSVSGAWAFRVVVVEAKGNAEPMHWRGMEECEQSPWMGIGERSLLLVELQGHLADVDAALSVLVYGDGLAVEVVGVAQRLEVGVAVSATVSYTHLTLPTICSV